MSFIQLTNKIMNNRRLVTLISVSIFLTFGIFYYLISPLFSIYSHAKSLPKKVRDVKAAIISQDYDFIAFEIDYIKEDLLVIDKSASRMQVFTILPYFGDYFKDLKNATSSGLDMLNASTQLFSSIQIVIPNLRFKGWGVVGDTADNTEADITNLSLVLSKELPSYKKKLFLINQRLDDIDSDKYPKTFRGIKIRDNLDDLKNLSSLIIGSFEDILSIIEILPDLSGSISPKNYLVVLVDNNELRPGGGVLTAYAVFNVRDGKVKIAKSGDVVLLDNRFISNVDSPEFMKKYLNLGSVSLKDAIFSPDFKISAESIKNVWAKVSDSYPIDGTVIVDYHFISSLYKELEAKSSYQVDITQKLNSFSSAIGKQDKENKDNKNVMTVLFYDMVKKSFSSSMQTRVDLFKTIFSEVEQKHIAGYFYSSGKLQKILESHNLDGRVKDYEGDYLLVSNFNIDGAVSDALISREIKKKVEVKEDKAVTTLTLSYTRNVESENSLVYKDYLRIYVPKSSKLLSSEGDIKNIGFGEDLNKTFFEGYLEVPAKSTVSFTLTYENPVVELIRDSTYKIYIQKQLGQTYEDVRIDIEGVLKDLRLTSDTEVNLAL